MRFTFNLNKKEFNMNKIKFISLTASLVFAMTFTLSCSIDELGGDSSSSSGGNGNLFSYCLVNGQCFDGPYTSKECGDLGGMPSNSCNGSGNPSSSSNGGQGGGGSSSSGGGQGGGGGGSRCPVSAVSDNSVTCGGQTYRTVQIGNQKWFAENLNYNVRDSKCYDGLEANCNTYGRLYNWETAMGVCPSGWHLPSDAEWQTLVDFADGDDVAAEKLKAASGWEDCGPFGSGKPYLCEDEFGFSAMPGGRGYLNDSFLLGGEDGYWWSDTEGGYAGRYAHYLGMYYNLGYASWLNYMKSYLLSVRCVQD
jgi:uncharacterized protein (TIGR02145 family)